MFKISEIREELYKEKNLSTRRLEVLLIFLDCAIECYNCEDMQDLKDMIFPEVKRVLIELRDKFKFTVRMKQKDDKISVNLKDVLYDPRYHKITVEYVYSGKGHPTVSVTTMEREEDESRS